MSDPKNFLSRWSERKLQPETEKPAPEQKEDTPHSADKVARKPSAQPAAEFDVSTLPPLDSITANSDIRAFLQRGVPAELTRAALRRAWSADPAIRDFVGLSENSWDFNAPDSIPGFGSFAPEELKQAAAAFFSGSLKSEDHAPRENSGASEQISSENTEKKSVSNADSSVVAVRGRTDVASQQNAEDEPINSARQKRRHGGALPE